MYLPDKTPSAPSDKRTRTSENGNDVFDGLRSEGYTWAQEEHMKDEEDGKLLVQACSPQAVACLVGP